MTVHISVEHIIHDLDLPSDERYLLYEYCHHWEWWGQNAEVSISTLANFMKCSQSKVTRARMKLAHKEIIIPYRVADDGVTVIEAIKNNGGRKSAVYSLNSKYVLQAKVLKEKWEKNRETSTGAGSSTGRPRPSYTRQTSTSNGAGSSTARPAPGRDQTRQTVSTPAPGLDQTGAGSNGHRRIRPDELTLDTFEQFWQEYLTYDHHPLPDPREDAINLERLKQASYNQTKKAQQAKHGGNNAEI